MLAAINHQSWLFFLPLAEQASLLKDDLLDPVDDLLDDEERMALVRQCLATRYPQSARTGRPGMAPDRLLRCCVLKHLKGWSFRELERELRCNLIYRRFTHFDAEVIPRHNCFSRLFAVLRPEVTQEIHQRVVGLACERGVAQGRRMQTDTTTSNRWWLMRAGFETQAQQVGHRVRVGGPGSTARLPVTQAAPSKR